MFRSERQSAILDELARNGRVSTAELAERFGVSEDSIRKDLQQLDAEGKAQRVYGGAVSVEEPIQRNVTSRVDAYRDQKIEIATKAYDLLEDGQTIFLDIASTNLYLADLLATGQKRVTVVSCMLGVLSRLAGSQSVTVQCPGGTLSSELNGFMGALTMQTLERFHFDAAFLGTLCLDTTNDSVSTFDMEDGLLKQVVLRNSHHTYLVADSHKFHAAEKYRYARMSDFSALIADAGASEYADECREIGIRVL